MNALKFCLVILWLIQVKANTTCLPNDIHALILARGGSKLITYKNLVEIDGLSLLSRTIITIRKSNCFEHIWVSTDDEKIALEATKYGALVHNRPEKYALDETSSVESVKEFLEVHKYVQNFALFQCTSVFLREKYIKQAVSKFKSHDCVFAVKRSHNLRWKSVNGQVLADNFNMEARPRRQDWKGDMVEAGMFYFSKRNLAMKGLLQNEKCAVVEIKGEDGLEIDSYRDLDIARCIVNSNK
ncbi:N-acylneuraminate cytidylyltransferase A [Drosophila grimshawi]|uniref:GH14727 n=1 Tax=Drosophila grimshawi TaxID=7222 RepID=B4IWY0_DROGR|nr:N-acylneuraminate cytidylyltransferase A [Drosophila grimshawi]EDV97381.1 GH14727 [Drosophila grimshawi]